MQSQQPYRWNGALQQPIQAPAAPDWSGWMQRLHQSELKLRQMTDQLADMQKQLDEIKNKPPLHIEYHFDQLKVNQLEGTLNVGLSPQGMQGIESFEAPNPACWNVAKTQPEEPLPPIRGLQDEMSAFMSANSLNVLMETERQFGVALEEDHRRRVIEDVRKQLNERVHYYARTAPYPSEGTDEERRQWADSIKEKTRRDIQGAFSAYLSKQRQQQSQSSRKGG